MLPSSVNTASPEPDGAPNHCKNWLVGILAVWLLWTTFIVLSSNARSGLVPDSVTYLDVAQQLVAGKGLTHRWAYWDPVYASARLPTHTSMWPPGYSVAIAAVNWLGLTPLTASRLIAGLFMSLVPLALYALARFVAPNGRPLLSTIVAIVCFPIARHCGMVITEPIFLLLYVLCIYSTLRAISAPSLRTTIAWLIAASVTGGIGYLFRYLAASCALALAIITVGMCTRRPRREWLPLLAAAGIPVTLLIGGWVLRQNYLGSAGGLAFEGNRKPLLGYITELPRNTLSEWLGWKSLYPGVWSAIRPIQLAALAMLILVAAVKFWRMRRSSGQKSKFPSPSIVVAIFLTCYLVMVYIGVVSRDAEIEARYITIIFPIVLLLMSGWVLAPTIESNRGLSRSLLRRAGLGACLVFCAAQALAIGRWFTTWPIDEVPVGATRSSPVIAWIREKTAPDDVLLSSHGAEIAAWCPNPVLRLQRRPSSAGLTDSWEKADALAAKAGARLLIHLKGFQPPELEIAWRRWMEILDQPHLSAPRHIATIGEHVIYRVGPSQPVDSGVGTIVP